ncbi:hypothetical protein OQI_17210 [Streptomyces pharetrae CZA14]|uniref:Uncharacterized protein n=1 Tax=Streptomyces pharetrae CZA14 TaxID=1144883 RepID=A0ABX3YK31_9ACTN|nr:hypothetical protein OQI_17210 [Streptomyces pharetrae CZA14]
MSGWALVNASVNSFGKATETLSRSSHTVSSDAPPLPSAVSPEPEEQALRRVVRTRRDDVPASMRDFTVHLDVAQGRRGTAGQAEQHPGNLTTYPTGQVTCW